MTKTKKLDDALYMSKVRSKALIEAGAVPIKIPVTKEQKELDKKYKEYKEKADKIQLLKEETERLNVQRQLLVNFEAELREAHAKVIKQQKIVDNFQIYVGKLATEVQKIK